MAVRIRLKRLGRKHRPFYRVCAMHGRNPRDGRVIEELGYYDPMIGDVDARAVLNGERISYWLGVGAQPTDKVRVLIRKYGENGTHLEQQRAALERIKSERPQAPPPVKIATAAAPSEEPAAEAPAGDEGGAAAAEEKPAEAQAAEQKPAEEKPAEEKPAGDAEASAGKSADEGAAEKSE